MSYLNWLLSIKKFSRATLVTKTPTKVSKNSKFGQVFKVSTFEAFLNWTEQPELLAVMQSQGIPTTPGGKGFTYIREGTSPVYKHPAKEGYYVSLCPVKSSAEQKYVNADGVELPADEVNKLLYNKTVPPKADQEKLTHYVISVENIVAVKY